MPATASARQTPPGARPRRRMEPGDRLRCLSAPDSRVGRARRPATGVPEEWPSRDGNVPDRTRLTGRLALIKVLILFALRSHGRWCRTGPDFMPVPDVFTAKTSPKTCRLAGTAQPPRERLGVNIC